MSCCAVLLPGFYATQISRPSRQITGTAVCPQGFVCKGGLPLSTFDPQDPTALPTSELTIKRCAKNTWTKEIGATDAAQCCKCAARGFENASGIAPGQQPQPVCAETVATAGRLSRLADGATAGCFLLVLDWFEWSRCWPTPAAATAPLLLAVTPPGYYTSDTDTLPCPAASFRADWKPPAEASSCTPCGVGLKADKTDRLVAFNLVTYAEEQIAVTTSSSDCCECCLLSGWGHRVHAHVSAAAQKEPSQAVMCRQL